MTTTQLPPQVKHGSGNAYSNYKCRCDLCRQGQGERNREYRLRNVERFREQRRSEYANNPDRFKRLTKERVDRHRSILNRYKILKGCFRCGYREHPAALEFHHRDPADKLFTISMSLGCAWALVKAEVRKCEVICSNCHSIIHARTA